MYYGMRFKAANYIKISNGDFYKSNDKGIKVCELKIFSHPNVLYKFQSSGALWSQLIDPWEADGLNTIWDEGFH